MGPGPSTLSAAGGKLAETWKGSLLTSMSMGNEEVETLTIFLCFFKVSLTRACRAIQQYPLLDCGGLAMDFYPVLPQDSPPEMESFVECSILWPDPLQLSEYDNTKTLTQSKVTLQK